jgi:hypothetical protein
LRINGPVLESDSVQIEPYMACHEPLTTILGLFRTDSESSPR